MKASTLVFSLAVLGGTATLSFAQATARSDGELAVSLTVNQHLLIDASGDAAAYSKAGDKVAGKPDTTAEYSKPDPLPNPPPPALEKVDYDIVVRRPPLRGTYKGVGLEDVGKFPRQVPTGVDFTAKNRAEKADDAGKATISKVFASVKASAPTPMNKSALLLVSGEVVKTGALPGIAVGRASDPWMITPDEDDELTLEVSLDVDLAASEGNGGGLAQIESCGAFDCVDCDDPGPVTWDYSRWVGPGETYNATESLVPTQTIFLQAGKTYKLVADLVSAAATMPGTQ